MPEKLSLKGPRGSVKQALMSALAYVADITNQPTETRLMRGQGLCFLHCWWKHQPKCWSWEALLPASFEVKFRCGSCSWNARPHVLQKQIYTLLLQKDAAFNLKSKVIREGKLTAVEPLIWVRQPVQVISVSPASPLWSRRGHYPCGAKKGRALPGRAICPKTTSASNQQVQRLNFLPLDSKPMVFELHPSAAACVHIFLSKIKGNGKKFSIMLYT